MKKIILFLGAVCGVILGVLNFANCTKAVEINEEIPEIYMACGDQDHLLTVNQEMAEFLRGQGVKVTFEVGPGNHEWDFWDAYIKKAIDWLPTEKNGLGINSGNVGI